MSVKEGVYNATATDSLAEIYPGVSAYLGSKNLIHENETFTNLAYTERNKM